MFLKTKNQKGFTIIETLIYLALFTILIGGVMISAYFIVQASSDSQQNTVIQEEANFLSGKIRWELNGESYGSSTVDADFALNGGNLEFLGDPINSNTVSITNLVFTKTAPDPITDKPGSLGYSFDVTSRLSDKKQIVSTIHYFRQ